MRIFSKFALYPAVCVFLMCASVIVVARPTQETSGDRGGTGDGFKRLDASSVVRNRRPGKAVQPGWYRANRNFPDGTPPRGKTYVTVGITIARGRLASDPEIKDSHIAKVNGCIQWDDKKCVGRKEMVLARTSGESAVSDKQQVQMTIEYLAYLDASNTRQSNRLGYLYVINREQYPDGTFSRPKLIFPTLNTYEGDNRVLPGKTVTMPEPERPWTISRSDSGKTQEFETYTIIVSPSPLKDRSGREIQPESRSVMLDEKLFDSWVSSWGGSEFRGDLENGSGQLVTHREVKSSGASRAGKRSTDDDDDDLKQDDPPPQLVFRKVVGPGGKLLVTIKLPFKDSATSASS